MFTQRKLVSVLIGSAILVVLGLAVWLTPRSVLAQGVCPESNGCQLGTSSCSTCHAKADPVVTKGEWHIVHAAKDVCRDCHGGNDQTTDKDLAHVQLVANPLDDVYLSCHQCHPDDYQARADRFAKQLGITAKSSQPVTTTAVLQAQPNNPQPQITEPKLPSASPDSSWLWLLAVLVAVLVGSGLIVMRHRPAH
jgi:hypothetical protein